MANLHSPSMSGLPSQKYHIAVHVLPPENSQFNVVVNLNDTLEHVVALAEDLYALYYPLKAQRNPLKVKRIEDYFGSTLLSTSSVDDNFHPHMPQEEWVIAAYRDALLQFPPLKFGIWPDGQPLWSKEQRPKGALAPPSQLNPCKRREENGLIGAEGLCSLDSDDDRSIGSEILSSGRSLARTTLSARTMSRKRVADSPSPQGENKRRRVVSAGGGRGGAFSKSNVNGYPLSIPAVPSQPTSLRDDVSSHRISHVRARSRWTQEEDAILREARGKNYIFEDIRSKYLPHRTAGGIRMRWRDLHPKVMHAETTTEEILPSSPPLTMKNAQSDSATTSFPVDKDPAKHQLEVVRWGRKKAIAQDESVDIVSTPEKLQMKEPLLQDTQNANKSTDGLDDEHSEGLGRKASGILPRLNPQIPKECIKSSDDAEISLDKGKAPERHLNFQRRQPLNLDVVSHSGSTEYSSNISSHGSSEHWSNEESESNKTPEPSRQLYSKTMTFSGGTRSRLDEGKVLEGSSAPGKRRLQARNAEVEGESSEESGNDSSSLSDEGEIPEQSEHPNQLHPSRRSQIEPSRKTGNRQDLTTSPKPSSALQKRPVLTSGGMSDRRYKDDTDNEWSRSVEENYMPKVSSIDNSQPPTKSTGKGNMSIEKSSESLHSLDEDETPDPLSKSPNWQYPLRPVNNSDSSSDELDESSDDDDPHPEMTAVFRNIQSQTRK